MATAEPSKEPTDSRLMRQLGTLRRSLIYAHSRARALDLRPEEANEALAGGDHAVLGAARMLLASLSRSSASLDSASKILRLAIESDDAVLIRLLRAANHRQEQLARARIRSSRETLARARDRARRVRETVIRERQSRRQAAAAAEKVAKQQRIDAMDPSLHGLIGYNEYECRCGKCRYAYTRDYRQKEELRRQRAASARQARKLAKQERLAAMDPALHGITGYEDYGCRCATCREAKTQADIEAWRSRARVRQPWVSGQVDEDSLLEKLRRSLCDRHRGVPLESYFSGEVIETSQGQCFDIQTEVSGIGFPSLEVDMIEAAILSQLCLLDGVGPATMARLRAEGYLRITDLVGHYAYGAAAAHVAGAWIGGQLATLHQIIVRRLGGGAGSSLGVHLGGMVPPEKMVILDLETLGLYNAPVFLLGIAEYCSSGLQVHQLLARSGAEEPPALLAALARLATADVVLTYNGRAADIPWLRQRANYYHLGPVPEPLHFDLLPVMRYRNRHDLLSGAHLLDCRLPTVAETFLGVARDLGDVPSWAIPEWYKSYEKERNIGPLIPIVEHNRADLVAVGHLYAKLLSEVCPD